MTLDEAIRHCEEVAEQNEKDIAYYTIQGDKEWLDECEKDCIECANEHRQLAEWLRELKRDREILDGLSIYFQSLAIDAVINQRPLIFNMRDATKEEKESVKRYIVDSAIPTGVNFWNLIGEVNADGKREDT